MFALLYGVSGSDRHKLPPESTQTVNFKRAFKCSSYWSNCFPNCFSSLEIQRSGVQIPLPATTEREDRASERAETHPWQCFLFVESVLGFDGRLPGAVSEERTTWNRGTPRELVRYTLGGEQNNKTGEFTWWSHQTVLAAAGRKTTQ